MKRPRGSHLDVGQELAGHAAIRARLGPSTLTEGWPGPRNRSVLTIEWLTQEDWDAVTPSDLAPGTLGARTGGRGRLTLTLKLTATSLPAVARMAAA